ncbi:hypothetical protein BCJMU51_p309 (plasmid) [Bacillus cereus]|uniref:hypothetical protein n=1 Tax=Bacillus TaxID=1386 RepID=UPI001BB2EEB3|nr:MULTISPECIES: hypothetical protein [Bacillus]BCC09594.1 hypothetical protein BCM0060_p333 [Bacillus cereus]BCC44666.1 hypothetical protein BCJMU01_p318 [Bacillus cereus]BCC50611.1 hypothetical protein BCJMU02_p308 [Bacillus cereus]BCC74255.1 hypothetical protein BCJMU51_p309 [Bacillus cereus]BCD33036.1 hypothetical protein BC30102_p705 [Bacillus cereus]
MSKKVDEKTLLAFLEQQGLMDNYKEFKEKKEEEENDPNIMTVKQVVKELNERLKDGNWTLQKVRRYIRERKIKTINQGVVKEENNSRVGYRIHREDFDDFVAFEKKSKWDLKIEVDKLLDYTDELKDVINNLKDEIKVLKEQKETK